jgi:hypothetical protein
MVPFSAVCVDPVRMISGYILWWNKNFSGIHLLVLGLRRLWDHLS